MQKTLRIDSVAVFGGGYWAELLSVDVTLGFDISTGFKTSTHWALRFSMFRIGADFCPSLGRAD
jgi:hypothetical protein